MKLNHFAVHSKLIQHRKLTILLFKRFKKKSNTRRSKPETNEQKNQLFPGANFNFWNNQSSKSFLQTRILEVNSFAVVTLQGSARR